MNSLQPYCAVLLALFFPFLLYFLRLRVSVIFIHFNSRCKIVGCHLPFCSASGQNYKWVDINGSPEFSAVLVDGIEMFWYDRWKPAAETSVRLQLATSGRDFLFFFFLMLCCWCPVFKAFLHLYIPFFFLSFPWCWIFNFFVVVVAFNFWHD